MYLLLGTSRMESRDHEGAIRSFERARAQMRPHPSRALLVISLVRTFANSYITTHRNALQSLTDIWMELR